MANDLKTYHLIADILSFTSDNHALKQTLANADTDWDNLVIVGSRHLVLPTIYCRLHKKELIDCLPNDLKEYLKEITAINRNRNQTILKEAKSISELFDQKNINYVFLKGCALIFGNYYQDIGERMIGDIDILVSKEDINKAHELLISMGYENTKATLSYNFTPQKHLPRIVSSAAIAAVELHHELLKRNHYKTELSNEVVLKNKKRINDINISNTIYLFRHNILSYLYDDHAAYYANFSFKCAYDTIVIAANKKIENSEFSKSIYQNFFNLTALFFDDLEAVYDKKNNISTHFFVVRLNNKLLNKIWLFNLRIIRQVLIYFHRFKLFLFNKQYRNLIFNHLKFNNVN